jgi:cytochrome c oxidase cbb3-type subunit 3
MVLTPDSATLLKLAKDPLMNKMGASIFQTNCVSCHGRHAEGVACPNLTDNYYIHVKKIEDFIDVITKGRNNGAMPAWGNRLRPNEIIVVAAYVSSLRNTNYPGGKHPEGTIPPPWTDDTTPQATPPPTTQPAAKP